ncbi:glycosyltransferase [uncultured Tateyamaria sp.]|uniref:glycosyltransferase n=1 Tax=uncultured Tateyamaria sp. TaxID=455651 RepID=UPI0026184B2E|nr:glycosyltransferase [uncultured Tateyamaria sp.]
MATCNGSRFIGAQLDSLLDQTHADWRLWVSDDGSQDDTCTQVRAFGVAHQDRLRALRQGPQQGSAANFLSLLADPALAGTWVAFCDQDDIWMAHKLARAVAQITAAGQPSIYASRTVLTDEGLGTRRLSPRHAKPFEFGNALVQNVLAGNTIVMPPAVTDVMRGSLDAACRARVPFHDWWMYLMATGAGMGVIYDDTPGAFYRQHAGNLMGDAAWRRLDRLRAVADGRYAQWMARNMAALCEVQGLLTPASVAQLSQVTSWRHASRWARDRPQTLGLYRQTRAGNAALALLARSQLI